MAQNNPLLLAVLGRGIQHPPAGSADWDLTQDLEVCDEKGAHFAVRVPENDDDPNSIVGGGELNMIAGATLCHALNPTLLVCGYGARSKYLNQIGAPSESKVMRDKLVAELERRNVAVPMTEVYDEEKMGAEESSTNRELYNIFTLAAERNIEHVAIVTVAVHLPRTALMAERHLLQEPKFKNIVLQCYASELVLEKYAPGQYSDRVKRMFSSKSYIRNLEREIRGINDLFAGKYKSVASTTN